MDLLIENINQSEKGIIFFNLKDLHFFKKKINFDNFTLFEFPYSYQQKRKALILPKTITAQEVINVITKAGKPLLENVELIDRFEGGKLQEGKCSQAFRIRYRSKDKTLTDEILEPIHEKIRKELTRVFRAELRS